MAETVHVVQGDTYTPVKFEIKDKESADNWEDMDPFDLTEAAKVVLKFKSLAEDRVVAELNCEYIDVAAGLVQVRHWGETFKCEPGVYSVELETHRHDGGIQTVHNTVRFKVRPEF
jgi:hypothetical protein